MVPFLAQLILTRHLSPSRLRVHTKHQYSASDRQTQLEQEERLSWSLWSVARSQEQWKVERSLYRLVRVSEHLFPLALKKVRNERLPSCQNEKRGKMAMREPIFLVEYLKLIFDFEIWWQLKECFISLSSQFTLPQHLCCFLFHYDFSVKGNSFQRPWVTWWSRLGWTLPDSASAHLPLSSPPNMFHILVMFKS